MQEYSLTELQSNLSSGELTSAQLVDSYLEQIDLIDRAGPTLNAIIEINPQAQEIAAELDGERAAGKLRGPLHGSSSSTPRPKRLPRPWTVNGQPAGRAVRCTVSRSCSRTISRRPIK